MKKRGRRNNDLENLSYIQKILGTNLGRKTGLGGMGVCKKPFILNDNAFKFLLKY